jgi:hypothetical protein
MARSDRSAVSFLAVVTILTALLVAGVPGAQGANGTLPGGSAISVTIDNPASGTELLIPSSDPNRDVSVAGTASVDFPANTLLIYVLDVSFSTIRGDGGTGCGSDQNGDGNSDTILDCEILSAKTMNGVAASTPAIAEVGVGVLGGHESFDPSDTGGAAADVAPAAGDQLVTGPGTDADGVGGADVNQVLNSAFSEDTAGFPAGVKQFSLKNVGSNGTNYAAGLQAALDIVAASSQPHKIVMFMSDGLANTGQAVSSVSVPSDVLIDTFAVGSVANCNGDPNSLGSLSDVAALGTGGTCTPVTNPANLPTKLPGVITPTLDSLDLSVDAGSPTPIGNADITPDLPQDGPVSVNYQTLAQDLGPGAHQVCVTANGTDSGGSGSVSDCVRVFLFRLELSPKTAVNELGPGKTHTVTATLEGEPGSVGGRTIDFVITSGPNAGVAGTCSPNADCTTDTTGHVSFTYPATQGLAGIGTDTIRGCVTLNQPAGETGCDTVTKTWQDTTAPVVDCAEGTNPHGQHVPPAGHTTLPGSKGGQNEDGFYRLDAKDAVDPNPQIFVADLGSGTVFGPFESGTTIKYTQAKGATPGQKKIGSTKGKAGAVAWHIIGNGDLGLYAVDASGNRSDVLSCLVPPPPK